MSDILSKEELDEIRERRERAHDFPTVFNIPRIAQFKTQLIAADIPALLKHADALAKRVEELEGLALSEYVDSRRFCESCEKLIGEDERMVTTDDGVTLHKKCAEGL